MRIGLSVMTIVSALLLPCLPSRANAKIDRPTPAATSEAVPTLRGLSPADAAALIGKLQELQRKLRAGAPLYFELLSGAPASYPMTTVSPRKAFLEMSFERPFSIERVQSGNPLWQPHKMVVAPKGPGQLIWEIEVVLGYYGDVERVEMIYRPPAPF